ncbi:metallophosphoesterase family protein [Paenibacillus agricola]|uniref:Metallophosphoesterase family protein n=1 Tax=Paenibacillus agricola TaxID=2716264 RepID=A0ABX0JHY3_9BACL|nr:metallophosphoesterase family protein [Paenibacillus agricola]NHN35193.1 metallophosphoesterase family protein [Paenibacillus agricola]
MDKQDSLSFRSDGTFTIVQFTDIHWQHGSEQDLKSQEVMRNVLEAERPDLVVFTGDVVHPTPEADPADMLRQAVAAVEERGIPWALIFGNHDSEAVISREQLMNVVLAHKHSLTQRGPQTVTGVGNYLLPIQDKAGKCGAVLYFFDSGNLSCNPQVDGYDWIRRDQISWYLRESKQLAEVHEGGSVPSLAFFHIPIPEYNEVWQSKICSGGKQEEVCCPKVNSGLFTAMVERADVIGTFCGHDHLNDYWGELHGIRLCYGRVTGENTYPHEREFPRGARIIRLYEGEPRFDTWIRLGSGIAIYEQPMHEPEGFN